MAKPAIPESEFIDLFEQMGAEKLARHLSQSPRDVHRRRRRLEEKLERPIMGPKSQLRDRSARIEVDLPDGVALVGSDAHYWPGDRNVGHRAFVKFAAHIKPDLVVMNGDVFDGSTISRHPPIGWEKMPTVAEELAVCKERMNEVRMASLNSRHFWTLGNHDARFETRLASVAPEYGGVFGVHLKDHFPHWEPCWSLFINHEDGIVIKHRFKGGIHAAHNNTLWAGRSILTGHLHRLLARPLVDYNGLRFGIEGGCLADPMGDQFVGYTEDNPLNWMQGFVALTFKAGRLLWPEFVYAIDDSRVVFRGEIHEV